MAVEKVTLSTGSIAKIDDDSEWGVIALCDIQWLESSELRELADVMDQRAAEKREQ